ncbi:MAG: restriction endonuclease subunit S [Saprospiraceae bacterium]|nr:restriction endonuclease subunit S [Saprospiraceae bacterium]
MSKWIESEISKIGTVVSGGTPSTTNSKFWNGDILFVTPYDLSRNKTAFIENTERKISREGLENSSANLLPIGSIILSSRAPIGYIAIAKKEFTTNQGCKSIIPNSDFDSEYFYYCFHFYVERIKKYGEGTTFAEISKGDLELVKFPHPKDKTEQRQIATILSTADAVIEKTQAAIAKYKAIKQGMLQDLFTRGIDTTTGKLRPSYLDAPELYKESKLGWIPREWNEEIFGEQIELVHGHQFRNYDFTEFGVSVVKIGQVKPENVDLSNCSFVSADRMEEFRNETIRNGDVLMALTGATLGKACLVCGLSNPVLQNYRVGRFEPKIKENDIDKSYLYYTLTAGELLNQIFNKVNSGAQGNIGKADFEKAFFKKPPFTEQKLIAERLNSLNKKLQTEQDFLHKQQQIKAGLMNDLLSGKKKVMVKEEIIQSN